MDPPPKRFDPTVPAILTGPYASPIEGVGCSAVPERVESVAVNPLVAFVTNPTMKRRGEDAPSTDALPVPW
jgi:hypothetical protein